MTNSTLIARLMGPVLLIMGIGTALGLLGVGMAAGDYTSVMREMADPALSILVGILTLLAGLAIVNAHNLWVSDWRVIITILGWLAIIRGVLSLLFPGRDADDRRDHHSNHVRSNHRSPYHPRAWGHPELDGLSGCVDVASGPQTTRQALGSWRRPLSFWQMPYPASVCLGVSQRHKRATR
jgi:hypothetical protein